MNRPVYDIEYESDGWWVVTRNGYPLIGSEFTSRAEAEAAVNKYENEAEADEDRDERMDRGDWEFHRDYDQ